MQEFSAENFSLSIRGRAQSGKASAICTMKRQIRARSRIGVLPDFFINAQAAVSQLTLLTRDVGRYRTYFPSLALISAPT